MTYTINEIEGVVNFLKSFSPIIDERRAAYTDELASDFFKNGTLLREGRFSEGDEVNVTLSEYTTFTRKEIKTETLFSVVRHDSFLLKLVKK